MRIIVLTDQADRHYYFANQLVERSDRVVGVVTGGKPTFSERTFLQRVTRKMRRGTVIYSLRNRVLNALFNSYGQRLWQEKSKEEDNHFGGAEEHFLQQHQNLWLAHVDGTYGSLNAPHYVELIREAEPDVIVIMGTCLVKEGIINSARHVINLHTGLSPYYRGGYTNLWPIIEEDFGYFGATIHKISLGIDSGDIIYTARPDIYPDDNYGQINSRCITLGADLMVRTLEHIADGTLGSVEQWTDGKLFYNRDMNHLVARQYFRKKQAFLEEYCRRERRGELDDVRLISNGQ